jgi:hypothetical protein
MTEIEQKLQKLEAEIDTKGGPLSKKEHIPNSSKTGLIVLSLVIIGSILLLSNQVNSQDRERWGIGLLGFGAGIAAGRIKR